MAHGFCIGGPRDGEWVTHDGPYFRSAQERLPAHIQFTGETSAHRERLQPFNYRLLAIPCAMGQAVFIWAPVEDDLFTVTMRLIAGYELTKGKRRGI